MYTEAAFTRALSTANPVGCAPRALLSLQNWANAALYTIFSSKDRIKNWCQQHLAPCTMAEKTDRKVSIVANKTGVLSNPMAAMSVDGGAGGGSLFSQASDGFGEAPSSSVYKAGTLVKSSGGGGMFGTTYKKRWFELKNGELKYWKDEKCCAKEKEKGAVPLDADSRLGKEEGDQAKKFQIMTQERLYVIIADNNEEMMEWLKVIKEAIGEKREVSAGKAFQSGEKEVRRHNSIETKTKQGELSKLSNTAKKWKQSYLMLSHAKLKHYRSVEDLNGDPKHVIDLCAGIITCSPVGNPEEPEDIVDAQEREARGSLKRQASAKPPTKWQFTVSNGETTFLLAAPTEELMKGWCEAVDQSGKQTPLISGQKSKLTSSSPLILLQHLPSATIAGLSP
jgi:hypothetical protein